VTEIALEMNNIGVAYHGDITILHDINLKFRRGKISGIIGPNGAGKSTVLKTIYGFLKLKSGSISKGETDIAKLSPSERITKGISYVPQHRSVFADLTVEDNIRLGCWPFRKDKDRVKAAFEKAYEMFPILREKRHELAGSMSGGQQRFLELARALIVDPEIVLLDEPTAMIAPKLSQEIYAFIEKMRDEGITVILVDQNVRQCAAVSDELFVLELGRNKASCLKEDIEGNDRLREMIGEWLDYQIDS
jgi:branched-chain amino acid transport system ATP-binding protein